ncbi:Hypothetical protein NTJ_04712 [Nesidiocoris tenuis]|nr:Hypothetical protein NTJ_04712 [Nesidiocoris tenuis]
MTGGRVRPTERARGVESELGFPQLGPTRWLVCLLTAQHLGPFTDHASLERFGFVQLCALRRPLRVSLFCCPETDFVSVRTLFSSCERPLLGRKHVRQCEM